jgi:hypothetical protein
MFWDESPAVVKESATLLLVQLCNPDPALREHRGRAGVNDKDLNWVLNRIDIVIKRLRYAERQAKILAAKKLRRRSS